LAVDLQLNPTSGWGNFGINVLVELAFNISIPFYPVITMEPNWRCNAAAYKQVRPINNVPIVGDVGIAEIQLSVACK
jgi:hypothetical protein